MHIEKNVFENIFNIIMDVKGKKKDNIKARLDVALFCNRKNMEFVCDESRVAKPRASFVLEKNAQLLVYKWLNSLHNYWIICWIVIVNIEFILELVIEYVGIISNFTTLLHDLWLIICINFNC